MTKYTKEQKTEYFKNLRDKWQASKQNQSRPRYRHKGKRYKMKPKER